MAEHTCSCGESLVYAWCQTPHGEKCIACGQRLILDHLRQQPFNLSSVEGYSDEKLERLLSRRMEDEARR